MILLGLIGVFQDGYDGDIRLFLVNLVSKSNVIMILVLFVVLVTISLMYHLYALLLPYQEQKAHEAWAERTSRLLRIEEANMHNLAVKQENEWNEFTVQAAAIANTRSLLECMKTEMAANRKAPKLLGVLTLDETLIQTIIAAITTSGTAFFSSFFTGILNEIVEASTETTMSPTLEPTAEPTMFPTRDPTAF